MIEGLVLGIIQGITEWLPISSDGMIVLAQTHLFGHTESVAELLKFALYLHFGTFLAALVYLWPDVKMLAKNLLSYQTAPTQNKKLIRFLFVSTVISGILGYVLYKALEGLDDVLLATGRALTALIGVALLATAYVGLKKTSLGTRSINDLTASDAMLLGIVQGLSVLPGLSRSGTTIAALLFKNIDETQALRISFLMSLPIVLTGNIILNLGDLASPTYLEIVALAASFIFGLLTIHYLLKLSRKINFGWFALFFGILTILAAVFTTV